MTKQEILEWAESEVATEPTVKLDDGTTTENNVHRVLLSVISRYVSEEIMDYSKDELRERMLADWMYGCTPYVAMTNDELLNEIVNEVLGAYELKTAEDFHEFATVS